MSKKILISLLIFVTFFSFLITPLQTAHAQAVVTDPIVAAWTGANGLWNKMNAALKVLWQKAGSVAFQQVARTALNKIAYDTANWIGSGGKGQKPLFITADWGDYLTQIGDEAAGQFIESFATQLAKPISTECQNAYQECSKPCIAASSSHNVDCGGRVCNASEEQDFVLTCLKDCRAQMSTCDNQMASQYALASSTKSAIPPSTQQSLINVCQPSSLQAKVKIGLGLVEQQRQGAPNCTASVMISNWGDEVQRYKDYESADFLKTINSFFEPTANDLGIYMSTREGMLAQQTITDENTKLNLTANKGWLNKTNAAKELIGIPNDAATKAEIAQSSAANQIARTTGDIVVDAANIFLNQIALTGFNTLMSNLGDTVSKSGAANPTDSQGDYSVNYGEGNLQEATASILKPNFGVQSDYDILSQLSICLDPKNPGPTDCVIDNKLAQGISEKKTVIEAIKGGFINGTWQITKDTQDNAYSLRNVDILVKYRILPIGWEEAINKAYTDTGRIKYATVSDLVSCYDASDSYNQFSSTFDVRNQSWCRGLVDPNWVLKAPLNYCRKEGSSAQIINKTVMPSIAGLNGNPYSPSTLNITRAENYCGDEQTCIKEKSDGSCEVYGYCNEEKRTWNFASESCDPIYNTCQSFTNPLTGKSVSYLENTLNYAGCNADSAGCRQYALTGAYATTTDTVNWNAGQSVYLNKNASTCNSKDEACTELLRVKPTWGSNLVMNADFSNDIIGQTATGTANLNEWAYWSSTNTINSSRVASIVDAAQEPGGADGKALKLVVTRATGNISYPVVGMYSNTQYPLLPDNFQLISGQSYTVSADVYLAEGHLASLYLGNSADGFVQGTSVTGTWQRLSVTRVAGGSFSEPFFGINADSSTNDVKVYIKNLKFEISDFATGYNIYGTYKVYEKIIPPYLEAACYNNVSSATKDYRLRADAPAECANFARKCNQAEVGCELFTGVNNGLKVSAQVSSTDYCSGQCLGYDTYISRSSYFNSPQAVNIIPGNAQACSADAAGCSEFTNLDAVNQGGESKEYYTAIKQCIKPNPTQCGSFYSWEGVDSGYQLRAYSLKKDALGAPVVSSDDSALCNASIYNASLSDPTYNADCREFYNSAGQVYYHLISKTITCADNCHAYRMSEKNVDKTRLTAIACAASPDSSHWDAANSVCNVCSNGGTWDMLSNACIYQVIPGEGKTCQAAQNGCREYNGNSGNNVRTVSSYDFESDTQGWSSNCEGGVQLTTISNDKDGHSILYKDGATNCSVLASKGQSPVAKLPVISQVFASANVVAQLDVSNLVKQGKSYSLRFIAKASVDTKPQIYFSNNDAANPQKAYFASSTLVVKGGGEWNIYTTNLENLDHEITPAEKLLISANHDFYFDDVVLTEITDRYYLIKDTSVIPDICYYDMNDEYQGADYNLGCTQYLDRDNLKHNLRKFSKLCSDSAVGCEQVIATQNYSPYGAGLWNDTNANGTCESNEPDCIKVDRDKAMYVVYDAKKQCNSADLGCSRLGMSASGTGDWSDVYKENNPNLYDSILCGQGEVGCEEWKDSVGTLNYFRDPGSNACQYRSSQDTTIAGKAWYKIPVKRCDLNGSGTIDNLEKSGKICTIDSDCANPSCIIDTNDYLCSSSYLKTFGLGGSGNQVPTPDLQAGLCEAKAAGCSEYIDPVSQYVPNLVYNPSYELVGGKAEGWDSSFRQSISIEANKLYIFSTRNNSSSSETTLTFSSGVKELLSDNSLATTTNSIVIPAQTNQSRIFTSLSNTSVVVTGGAAGKTIELKNAITNYQLKTDMDKSSCNGIYNVDAGCILFNERSINGASGLVDLSNKWDAQASVSKAAPANCDSTVAGSCTANQLIKVSPNRVCSKWLDCMTYVQDPETKERTCYAVGECTRLNDQNECANFEDEATGNIKFDASGSNKNATGYYLLDKYHLANMTEVGVNTDAHFDFEDNVPALSCQRVGGGTCLFTKNIVSDLLVREPEKTPTDYPAHGASFLRVPASYLVSPQSSNNWTTVIPKSQYFVNFLLNTKNTGLGAYIKITEQTSTNGENTISSSTVYSNSGWSRQILAFNTGDNTKNIKIYIGTSDEKSDREIYIDDINIEPVLAVGKDAGGKTQYVARECRLYPTNDSLTCVNKNNNVLSDGWEGYCLKHDPNNKDVCLMWYPVDSISSSLTERNTSGYQGKFPLNYCTEVNGNFDLVEKRKTILIANSDTLGGCDSGNSYNGFQSLADSNTFCGADYVLLYYEYGHSVGNHDHCMGNDWCVPRKPGLIAQIMEGDIVRDTYSLNSGESTLLGVGENRTNGGESDPRLDVVVNSNGWYKYNGYAKNNTSIASCDDSKCTNLDEEKNADPAIRVLDYAHMPADEDGLKLISGTDQDKIFRLTCNNFVQAVDYNGDNQAWAVRTGINSLWSTTTPPYFTDHAASLWTFFGNVTSSIHKISAYGRNRQDTPFGAALWPDNFNLLSSEAVNLRNQFSAKNNESVLAGRPYGCSNYKKGAGNTTELGSGCSEIGYCSLDPNVYCLVGNGTSTDYVSRKTCSDGGFGSCVPLWSNYLGANDTLLNGGPDFKVILRNLFLKSYNSFGFSDGSYTTNSGSLDSTPGLCANGVRPVASYNSVSESAASFCAIKPRIGSDIKIKYKGQVVANGSTFTINEKGIYSLEFTTMIDPEQQPLKSIYIYWGDGTTQVITGQDSRSSAANPHIFYHYYKSTGPVTNFGIKILDNWGQDGYYGYSG
ncbi:MAG: hypothetical protein WC467_03580 [Patescibacteria group bacterium]